MDSSILCTMHLFILILGSMLLPKAYALKCNQCSDVAGGTCIPHDCSSSDQCGAVRLTTYVGKSPGVAVNIKSCVPSDHCVSGSVNFGNARTIINTKCCSTDLCNSQNAPEPSASSNNGKMCYSCTDNVCTGTINCMGDEDRCISTSVKLQNQKITMKGCASKIMCSAENMRQASEMRAAVGADFSCCEGNMCNSARSTGVGLLLLVAPMAFLPLFL